MFQKTALFLACITMVLSVVARVFFPFKILLGLGAITYLRLTITLLLFSLAFHFAYKSE